MQRCTDCGHSNRSGVHYCTHCGKPVVASGASLSGPTTMVAAAVLAIGLLAFLTIRPVASTQSPGTIRSSPSALHESAAAADEASPLPAAPPERMTVGREAVDPARALDEAVNVTGASDGAVHGATALDHAVHETKAPDDAVNEPSGRDAGANDAEAVASGDEAVAPSSASAGGNGHDDELAGSALAALPLEPATQAADGSSARVEAMPGLDPSLASVDIVRTPSSELMTPASSAPASALALQAAPELAGRARALDAVPGEQPSVRLPVRPPAHRSPATSSSGAKRAALERGARRDVGPARAKASEPWLRRLRAEIEACDGNFIVRTVCAERAKMRHCTSADAWGEVPECPAARVTELATFN